MCVIFSNILESNSLLYQYLFKENTLLCSTVLEISQSDLEVWCSEILPDAPSSKSGWDKCITKHAIFLSEFYLLCVQVQFISMEVLSMQRFAEIEWDNRCRFRFKSFIIVTSRSTYSIVISAVIEHAGPAHWAYRIHKQSIFSTGSR